MTTPRHHDSFHLGKAAPTAITPPLRTGGLGCDRPSEADQPQNTLPLRMGGSKSNHRPGDWTRGGQILERLSGRWLALCLVLTLLTTACADEPTTDTPPPQSIETTAQQAIAAYREALDESDRTQRHSRFAQAAQLFRQVTAAQIDDGQQPSASLWANAGNAAFQAEETGQAILAYRRALSVDPTNETARANLQATRQELPAHLRPLADSSIWSALFFWNEVLAGKAAAASGMCFVAAAGLWAFGYRFQRPMLRNLAIVPAVFWIVLLGSAAMRAQSDRDAVIIEPDVVARTADSQNAPAQFANPLPAGVEVTIEETRLDWIKARLPSGATTWLPRSSVQKVSL